MNTIIGIHNNQNYLFITYLHFRFYLLCIFICKSHLIFNKLMIIHEFHSIFKRCKLYSHYSDDENDQKWVKRETERAKLFSCCTCFRLHSLIHLFTYSLTHSVAHSFIRSLVRWEWELIHTHLTCMQHSHRSLLSGHKAYSPATSLATSLSPFLSLFLSLSICFPLYLGYLSLPPLSPLVVPGNV